MRRLAGWCLLLLTTGFGVALGWQDWYAEGAVLDLNGSLVVAAHGAGVAAGAWTAAPAGDLSGTQLQLRVMSPDWAAVRLAEIVVSTRDGFSDYLRVDLRPLLVAPQPGEWLHVAVPAAAWSTSSGADWSTTEGLVLRVTARGDSTAMVALGDLQFVTRRAERGAVTLSFDDGRKDVIDRAFPLMQERGLVGTAYVIPELIGHDGFMDQQDLYELHAAGWEVAAHGEHPLIWMTDREARQHLRFAAEWLAASGFGDTFGYAYPNGLYNARVRDLTAEYFDTGRTINARSDLLGYAPRFELGGLSVYPELGADELLAEAEAAVANGEWLNLVFHLLADEPEHDTQYPLGAFTEILDGLAGSGWPVLRAADAWQLNEGLLQSEHEPSPHPHNDVNRPDR